MKTKMDTKYTNSVLESGSLRVLGVSESWESQSLGSFGVSNHELYLCQWRSYILISNSILPLLGRKKTTWYGLLLLLSVLIMMVGLLLLVIEMLVLLLVRPEQPLLLLLLHLLSLRFNLCTATITDIFHLSGMTPHLAMYAPNILEAPILTMSSPPSSESSGEEGKPHLCCILEKF